ncbi:MAG: glycosyltransferase family 2 protein [Desulfuromonadales bacterium]|nr:glycosyltransferase family 2 protein [Desulfuromonadales bacterium]
MNVTIGIPTINSSNYIFSSLVRIKNEIAAVPENYICRLVVCVNGSQDEGKTRIEIERFKFNTSIPLDIIEEGKAGKNNALNCIVSHARQQHRCDIIYFFDDDVAILDGSLGVNLTKIAEHEFHYGLPVLVGSSMLGIQRSLRHFVRIRHSLIRGILSWSLHRLFIMPYLLGAEKPKFCEGLSLGTFLKYMPAYPDDETGITDDTFLSNFFACQGMKEYLNNGIPPIIKPPNSLAYVEITHNYREWRRQQLRIHAGIRRSFNYFHDRDKKYLEEFFQWPYAFNSESRVWPKGMAKTKWLLYLIYRFLHAFNESSAHRMVKSGMVPDWCAAVSTKHWMNES